MSSNVEVPTLGESINEAVLLQWLKNEGDHVAVDEPICELESDKATVDLPAPTSGILHPKKKAGETAHVGEVIAQIDEDGESAAKGGSPASIDAGGSTAEQASSDTQDPQQRQTSQSDITPKEKW